MHNLRMISGFAIHVIGAAGLFALIGGAAALLGAYTRLLERAGMSPLILQAVHLTEYVLFAADLLCFLVYVAREVWLLLRDILQHDPSKLQETSPP